MTDVTIRILHRQPNGTIEDGQHDFDLASFGGVLPAVGDMILDPGVIQGRDRRDPANREMWTVVGRLFNPRDNADYIALIVETRPPRPEERELLPGG